MTIKPAHLQHASWVNDAPWALEVAVHWASLAKQLEACGPQAKGALAVVVQLHMADDELVLWDGKGLVGVTKLDVVYAAAAEVTPGGLEQLPACWRAAVSQGPGCLDTCGAVTSCGVRLCDWIDCRRSEC